MTEELDIEDIKKAEDYLEGYRTNGKLLFSDKYEKKYFTEKKGVEYESIGEVPLARARMFEIRHFIGSLKNSDEKLFLYYYYIKGRSTEKCAELLGVSRSTAFRLKKRAIRMAAEALLQRQPYKAD